eukprot:13596010-Alexandrium_andersonii.AAC.1
MLCGRAGRVGHEASGFHQAWQNNPKQASTCGRVRMPRGRLTMSVQTHDILQHGPRAIQVGVRQDLLGLRLTGSGASKGGGRLRSGGA